MIEQKHGHEITQVDRGTFRVDLGTDGVAVVKHLSTAWRIAKIRQQLGCGDPDDLDTELNAIEARIAAIRAGRVQPGDASSGPDVAIPAADPAAEGSAEGADTAVVVDGPAADAGSAGAVAE